MSQFHYQTSYRRRLPHIQPPGATIFVTFRLAGSIPMNVLNQLHAQRREVEQKLALIPNQVEREIQSDVEERKFFGKWDQALDTATNGPYWLKEEKIAKLVADSLHYQDTRVYELNSFCIMPNHVHLICTPLAKTEDNYHPLSTILHAIKRHTAYHANQILNRSGDFWQHESYDHYVRDEQEFNRVVNYVLNNPVTAGLVSDPTDWKWSYSRASL